MSLTYNKIYTFVADIANKVNDLATDQLAIALTDTLPTTALTTSFPGEISYANFSGSNPNYITTSSSTQSSGTYKLILGTPLTLTATGTIPQWRYIGIKDTTSGRVIAWFDYGSEVNMAAGDQLSVAFDGTNGLLQIA